MTEGLPPSARSAVAGDRASVSGVGAALLVHKLLPPNPKRELLHAGLSGGRLQAAMEAVEALRDAAAAWQGEHLALPSESPKADRKLGAAESTTWISSSDASKVLGVTPQAVGQMAKRGELGVVVKEGGRLRLDLKQVQALALHRRKTERTET